MAATPFADTFPADYELTRLLAVRRAARQAVIDLTESNPAALGLSPDAVRLAPALTAGARGYRPEPCGAAAAREAVAACYRERGMAVAAEQVVLTASTSEAYGWLFKLLCGAGDRVLVPVPGYPLCADLGHLERGAAAPYRLIPGASGWRPDRAEVAAGLRRGARGDRNQPAQPDRRVSDGGRCALAEHGVRRTGRCAGRGRGVCRLSLGRRRPRAPRRRPALTFLLGGLSKTPALPQLKCGWIVVAVPRRLAGAAAAHLAAALDERSSQVHECNTLLDNPR